MAPKSALEDIYNMLGIPIERVRPTYTKGTRSPGLQKGRSAFEPPLGLQRSKNTTNWDALEKPEDYPSTTQNPQDAGLPTERVSVDSFTLKLPPSSTVQQATYWIDDKYLMVSFKSGGQYGYDAVPIDAIANWMKAASAGHYFYYNIRTSFPYKKV